MTARTSTIHLAYSLTTKHGRLYHARAYLVETFPAMPLHVYASDCHAGNDHDSADLARAEAVKKLLKSRPDLADCQILDFGRRPDLYVSSAPAVQFKGKSRDAGTAREFVAKA